MSNTTLYLPFVTKKNGQPKDIDWFANGTNGFGSWQGLVECHEESRWHLLAFGEIMIAVCQPTTKEPPKNHIKYIKTSYNPNFKVGDVWLELVSILSIVIKQEEIPVDVFKFPRVGNIEANS